MTDSSGSPERCVLCLDQKRSPVRILCGHSFCFECLNVYKTYQKYAWANKCPICRDALKENQRAQWSLYFLFFIAFIILSIGSTLAVLAFFKSNENIYRSYH